MKNPKTLPLILITLLWLVLLGGTATVVVLQPHLVVEAAFGAAVLAVVLLFITPLFLGYGRID